MKLPGIIIILIISTITLINPASTNNKRFGTNINSIKPMALITKRPLLSIVDSPALWRNLLVK